MFSSQFSKMVPIALKMPNMFPNLSKRFKMVKQGQKWTKRINKNVQNYSKLSKIV